MRVVRVVRVTSQLERAARPNVARERVGVVASRARDSDGMPPEEISRTIVELEEEMLLAADDLRFEYAAKLRDEIKALRRELDEAEARA